MLAIDTNVVIRYLTGDQPSQAAKAGRLLEHNNVFVCTTVLLETEWVLRSIYRYPPARVARALADFCGLPQVTLEDPVLTAKALDWMGKGMDFADALHVGRAETCDAFVSFDESFIRLANDLTGMNVRTP